MNVQFSFKAAKTPDVQREIDLQTAKLGRRLQIFKPELVHLHGSIEQGSSRSDMMQVSLNLRLPSGQIAAQESAPMAVAALKEAFRELVGQLGAHKDLLRKRHKWNRHPQENRGEDFDKTIAAVHAPTVSQDDISAYVNANVDKLERFIQREIQYREANGRLDANFVTKEEVLDEAIVSAMGSEEERPEVLSLERWLYRLALRAIDEISSRNGEALNSVRLEEKVGQQNVTGSDENRLQFHQPDDYLSREQTIADPGMLTPEAVASSDELISQVEDALLGVRKEDREAFVLYAIEGFSIPEIAHVCNRSGEEVRDSIEAMRRQIEEKLPRGNMLKGQLTRPYVA